MNVVPDTNVLVSGLISPFGPAADIMRLLAAGAIRACYDPRILGEYREVLARPAFGFAPEPIEALLDQIKADGVLVTAPPLATHLPDPDDEVFLAVAITAGATCLVTGNLRHFPEESRQGLPVVSPRRFLDQFGDDLARADA